MVKTATGKQFWQAAAIQLGDYIQAMVKLSTVQYSPEKKRKLKEFIETTREILEKNVKEIRYENSLSQARKEVLEHIEKSEEILRKYSPQRVLYLTLKKQWFDMILSGEKKEEYRAIKPYWEKRLLNKEYDIVNFRNGYGKSAPQFTAKIKNIRIKEGKEEWGAVPREKYFVIELSDIRECF